MLYVKSFGRYFFPIQTVKMTIKILGQTFITVVPQGLFLTLYPGGTTRKIGNEMNLLNHLHVVSFQVFHKLLNYLYFFVWRG